MLCVTKDHIQLIAGVLGLVRDRFKQLMFSHVWLNIRGIAGHAIPKFGCSIPFISCFQFRFVTIKSTDQPQY